MAKERRLTERQKKWAQYYVENGNATEAARKAGYKGGTTQLGVQGAENRNNPKILRYIEETYADQLRAKQEAEQQRIAKGSEVLRFLTNVMRGEEKDQFGLDAQLTDRINAAKLLGQRYALFREVIKEEKADIASELQKRRKKVIDNGSG